MSEARSDKPTGGAGAGRGVVDVLVYVIARLLLLGVVSGVIYGVARLAGVADFPVVLALLGGLVVSMPLGMWVFSPLRVRATRTLAAAGERRRSEREQLRARLRGEVPPEPGSDQG